MDTYGGGLMILGVTDPLNPVLKVEKKKKIQLEKYFFSSQGNLDRNLPGRFYCRRLRKFSCRFRHWSLSQKVKKKKKKKNFFFYPSSSIFRLWIINVTDVTNPTTLSSVTLRDIPSRVWVDGSCGFVYISSEDSRTISVFSLQNFPQAQFSTYLTFPENFNDYRPFLVRVDDPTLFVGGMGMGKKKKFFFFFFGKFKKNFFFIPGLYTFKFDNTTDPLLLGRVG